MKSSEIKFANPKFQGIDFDINVPTTTYELFGIILYVSAVVIIVIGLSWIISTLIQGSLGCLFLWLLLCRPIVVTILKIFRLSKKYLHNPRVNFQTDSRDPVLYLRSFSVDLERDEKRGDKKTPEELLSSVLNQVGHVLAVGNPMETIITDLPYLGATRIYFNEEWKLNVKKLMSISKLVIINADCSENVLWELETAKNSISIEKLLISFLAEYNSPNHEQSYYRFASEFRRIFSVDIPPYHEHLCFIYFHPDKVPYSIIIKPNYDDFGKSKIPLTRDLTFSDYYLSEKKLQASLLPMFQYYKLLPSENSKVI